MKVLQTNQKNWIGNKISFIKGAELEFDSEGKSGEVEDKLAKKLVKTYEGFLFYEGKGPEVEEVVEETHSDEELKAQVEELKGKLLSSETIIRDLKGDVETAKKDTDSWKEEYNKLVENDGTSELKTKIEELEKSNTKMSEELETSKEAVEIAQYESQLLRLQKKEVLKIIVDLGVPEKDYTDEDGKTLTADKLVDKVIELSKAK